MTTTSPRLRARTGQPARRPARHPVRPPLGGYGLGRLWVEALRIDDATRLAGVRVNLWVSLLAVTASAGALAVLPAPVGTRTADTIHPDDEPHLAAS